MKCFSLVVVTFLMISCTKKEDNNALITAISSSLKTHKPSFASDLDGMNIHGLIYSSLVHIGQNREIIPDLASEMTQTEFKKYVFKIKQAFFHDGTPITLEDVKFSIEKVLDPSYGSPFLEAFKKIESIIIKDQTLEILLKDSDQGFLADLAVLKIAPKSAYEGGMLGSGPYKLIEYNDNEVKLESFDKFYEPVKQKKLIIKTIKDQNTAYLKLLSKEVDLLLGGISAQRFIEVQKDQKLGSLQSPGLSYSYIAFNFKHKELSKVNIRNAIAMAVDRKLLVEKKLLNTASLANAMFGPESKYGIENVIVFDQEKSRSLMVQEGYSETKKMKLEFKVSTDPEAVEIANAIAADLAKIYIDMSIKPMEWASYYSDLKEGNFEITSSRRVGITAAKMLYDVYHSKNFPPLMNRTFTKDEILDKLLEQLYVSKSENEVIENAKKAQIRIAELMPYLPLWYKNNLSFYQKNIKGLVLWPNMSFRCLLPIEK